MFQAGFLFCFWWGDFFFGLWEFSCLFSVTVTFCCLPEIIGPKFFSLTRLGLCPCCVVRCLSTSRTLAALARTSWRHWKCSPYQTHLHLTSVCGWRRSYVLPVCHLSTYHPSIPGGFKSPSSPSFKPEPGRLWPHPAVEWGTTPGEEGHGTLFNVKSETTPPSRIPQSHFPSSHPGPPPPPRGLSGSQIFRGGKKKIT